MGFHDNNLSDCPWSLSVHSWIRTSSIWIFSWYLLYNTFIVFNSIYRFHLYTLQKQYYIIIMLCIYMYITCIYTSYVFHINLSCGSSFNCLRASSVHFSSNGYFCWIYSESRYCVPATELLDLVKRCVHHLVMCPLHLILISSYVHSLSPTHLLISTHVL